MVCIWTEPAGTGRMRVSSRPHPKCCSLSCRSSTCMPLTAPAPWTPSCTCAPSTRSHGEPTSITSRQWFCPPCCLPTTGSCGVSPSCVISNKLLCQIVSKKKFQFKVSNTALVKCAITFYSAFWVSIYFKHVQCCCCFHDSSKIIYDLQYLKKLFYQILIYIFTFIH